MNFDFLEHEAPEDARAALQSAVRIVKQVGIFKGGKKKFADSPNLVSISQTQSAILTTIIAEIEYSYGKPIRQMTEKQAVEALHMLAAIERELWTEKSSESSYLADDFLTRLTDGKI